MRRHAARDPRAFEVAEEERPVLHDRAADVAAVLVLIVGRLGGVRLGREVVDRVEALIAEVVVERAPEAVGARLGRDADRRTRRPAVFSRVRAGDDLELLNRVHRGARHLGGQFLDVLRDAVVVHAVEEKVVLQGARAMDVDAAGPAKRRAAALLGVALALHAGHKRQQIVPVANGQRQVCYLLLRDDRAQRRVVGVQHLHAFRDGHRLVERTDGELDVEARALADLERDDLRALLEAAQLDVDLVAAGDQVDHLIRAGLGRHLVRLDVGRRIGHGDRGARHHAAAAVADDVAQRRAIDLRGKIRREQ